MDGQAMIECQARVTVVEVSPRCVLLQPGGERRERVSEALQEGEDLFWREQVFHHHEAHEVQAEVSRDRGGFYRRTKPARVRRPAGLGWLIHAAMPG